MADHSTEPKAFSQYIHLCLTVPASRTNLLSAPAHKGRCNWSPQRAHCPATEGRGTKGIYSVTPLLYIVRLQRIHRFARKLL